MASGHIPYGVPLSEHYMSNVTTRVTVTSETNPALDILRNKVIVLESELIYMKTVIAQMKLQLQQQSEGKKRARIECEQSGSSAPPHELGTPGANE